MNVLCQAKRILHLTPQTDRPTRRKVKSQSARWGSADQTDGRSRARPPRSGARASRNASSLFRTKDLSTDARFGIRSSTRRRRSKYVETVQDTSTQDRRWLLILRAVWVVLMSLLVLRYVWTQVDPDRPLKFSRLINFAHERNFPLLPEVEALEPQMLSRFGYDGQFYAQMAVRPSLRPAETMVPLFDLPSYRARRILLPALAWTLGAGRPAAVLDVYASLNVVFYIVFCLVLAFGFRARTVRDFAVITALALAPGTLLSIKCALTDLPAVTLTLLGLLTANYVGAWIMAAAILTRESSILTLASIIKTKDHRLVIDRNLIMRILIAVVPFALWAAYVRYSFGAEPGIAPPNFGFPLVGWVEAVTLRFQELFIRLNESFNLKNLKPFVELAALVALLAQMLFLSVHARWKSPTWRYGAGYVVFGVCLGMAVLEAQSAYQRALLPMTIAFFLELRERPAPGFWIWFCAGSLSTPFLLLPYLR